MDKTMAYACKNIDSEIRLKSSSGGVFYALADNSIWGSIQRKMGSSSFLLL